MTTQTELLREALELADAYANAFNNSGSSLYNPTTAAARKALSDKLNALLSADSKDAGEPVPLENSQEASDAIDAMLAAYHYPANPKNAARAGWKACRLHTRPQAADAQPLSEAQRKQITAMWSRENRNYTVSDIIDAVERAHGITGKDNAS